MKKIIIAFAVLFVSQFLVLTPTAVAAEAATGVSQLAQCSGPDCSACNLVYLVNGLITWLIGFAFLLFAVLFCIAGVRMVMSGGNSHSAEEAKGSFVNAIVGLIIILSAWLIVDTVMRTLVGNDGMLATEGSVSGWLYWSEVQCQVQTVPDDYKAWVEETPEDVTSVASPCNSPSATVAEINRASCNITPCTAVSCLTSCLNIRQGADIGRGAGNYCVSQVRSIGSLPSGIITNPAMGPIFDPAQGGSSLVKDGAAARMQQTLAGPFARLQQQFGRAVVINDAIAKAGSSRETETQNSRHFYGDALDLSTAGMSDADKIRLFETARSAGFTGFGFGNNILHVDLGTSRGWAYGNSTYGGRPVSELINSI
jgi:hypothetical protein